MECNSAAVASEDNRELSLKGFNGSLTLRRTCVGDSLPDLIDFKIEVEAQDFRGNAYLEVLDTQFVGFARELEKRFAQLRGFAILESLNGNEIRIDFDKMGHVEVSGRIRNVGEDATCLQFSFGTDQTYIGPLIIQLRELISASGAHG
ncbi:MAG: WapI family immunity protein [Fimbriimonadales bacterium]